MSDENVAVNYTDSKRGVSAITCITVATFSLASWIAINGIWVELPNFIYELPEGFKLPSYLTVICQIGNIGCITYFLSKKYCPVGDKRKVEHFAIIAMLCAGYIACVLLGFLWNKTTMIGNKETSFAFLFLVFIVSLVDCTSSVTFLPFMAILPRSYISPFFIGETLSSFVPSIIALIQGPYVLHNNKTTSNETSTRTKNNGLLFSQGWFFASLAFLMVVSLLAYVALNYVPFFKRQHVKQLSSDGNFDSDTEELISEKDVPMRRDNRTLPYLLILLLLLSFQQNGLVPSISSYAFAPYGTVPYHLVAALSPIAAACTCLIYLRVPMKSVTGISILSSMYTVMSVVVLVMALQSPNPFLKGKKSGQVISVLLSVFAQSFVAYSKLSIASIMREEGKRHLFYSGLAIQLGSFLGAVVIFPIVNYAHVFKS